MNQNRVGDFVSARNMTRAIKVNCTRFALVAAAVIVLSATPIRAQLPPTVEINHISLNPTSFYVSTKVANTVPLRYFALEAYEGEPVGANGGVQRTIVSDWTEGTGSTLILNDTSAPLSQSGRTYNVAVTFQPGEEYILGVNEAYAPYPFFTSPAITSITFTPTNTGNELAITYGEGLYTNTVYIPGGNTTGFFRVMGTNHIPTNAVIEQSLEAAF